MNRRFGYGVVLLALAAVAAFPSGAWAANSSSPASGAAARGGPSPGYLGVDLRDVNEEQGSSARQRDIRGAEIVLVDHDAPAGTAGLREHDIVLRINGQAIGSQDQARRILHECQPSSAVVLSISREGQLITVTAKMSSREEVERDAWSKHVTVPGKEDQLPTAELGLSGSGAGSGPASPQIRGGNSFIGSILMNSSYTGAMLEQLSTQLAQFFGVPTGSGLLVRSVVDNSPAAAAGMHAGDVVVQANGKAVGSTGDWAKAVKGSHGRPLPVVILRDKKQQTLTLTPDGKHRSCVEELFQTQERTLLAYLSFSWR